MSRQQRGYNIIGIRYESVKRGRYRPITAGYRIKRRPKNRAPDTSLIRYWQQRRPVCPDVACSFMRRRCWIDSAQPCLKNWGVHFPLLFLSQGGRHPLKSARGPGEPRRAWPPNGFGARKRKFDKYCAIAWKTCVIECTLWCHCVIYLLAYMYDKSY